MRNLLLSTTVFAMFGCVAPTSAEANGYNVQLYFDGAPLGSSTPINEPALVTVRRLEQQTDQTTETPITLISASCDAICSVVPTNATNGAVALQATAKSAGSTTLRVRVRSEVDGAEWDDGYPLSFGEK